MAITAPPLTGTEAAAQQPLSTSAASDTSLRWGELVLRIGFLTTGVALLHWALLAWARGNIFAHHETIFIVLALYGGAFACLGLGVVNLDVGRLWRMEVLIPLAIIVSLLGIFYIELKFVNNLYSADTLAFSHEAADRLLAGENPFSANGEAVIANASERFGVPKSWVTPRTDGSTIDNLVSWPAGSFLAFVIPSALGLDDMRWVVAAAQLVAFGLLWLWAPRALRPLVFIPLVADPDIAIRFTTGGTTDILWLLPILGCAFALHRQREVPAALLYGLAVGIKQQPWLLAPFLLIWLWNAHRAEPLSARFRSLGTFAGWSALGFLALNGPFILWDVKAWFEGVLLPVQVDLIPWGSGLSMLTQAGVADLSRNFYSLATFGVWALLILAYALHFRNLKHLIWLFPALIMWFNYRSLQNYFVFWVPLLLMALFFWWEDQVENREPANS